MRNEFSAKTKVAAFERSGGQCEQCTRKLYPGDFHYDHEIPDQLGGSNGLDNCRVLCRSCHGSKTAEFDIPHISKAKRIEQKHVGAQKSRSPIRGWRKFNGEPVRNPRAR